MKIPSECKMPDLSWLLDTRLTSRLMVRLLIGEIRLNGGAGLYLRNFIRLLDKAIREYQESRGVILDQIEEANRSPEEMEKDGRYLFIFTFTDRIENCINSIARVFRLLERIKSEKVFPLFPRELRRLVETKNKSIREFRDTIEHMDEKIQKGDIAQGTYSMPIVSNDDEAVIVSKLRIELKDLAMVLMKMHEIALYILADKKVQHDNSG